MDAETQLQEAIAALQQALAAVPHLPAAQAALLAQLASYQRKLAALRDQPTLRVGDRVGGDKVLGDKVLGDKYVQLLLPGSDPDEQTLLREYLGELSRECRRLSLADVESSDPGRLAVDLAQIYTGLEVAALAGSDDDLEAASAASSSAQTADPEQYQAMAAIRRALRLVLLGAPGSGKSSLLSFIGLCMAQTLLGNPGWLERLHGWPDGARLPLRVRLGEFAAWLGQAGQSTNHSLWDFLGQRHAPALVVLLRRAVAAGQAIILLDGLDEVAGGPRGLLLRRVRDGILSLSETAGASPIIVSCRTLDYAQPERQLSGWAIETLLPFAEPQQRSFIARWFAALARLERPLNGDPQQLRDRLQAEVRGRPELRRLAGNPLLLTLMTLLHAYEGRLPEERVRLYERAVTFLLHHWRAAPGQTPLRELLELPQWGESDLNRLVDRLGYAAHALGVSGDAEVGADLPRSTLIAAAQVFFAPYGADQDLIRAQQFCNYISRFSNGLIQQSGPEVYRFPHRTFQEYLAARRLVADDWDGDEAEFVDRVLRHVGAGAQWREPIMLAISQQVVVGNQVRPCALLVEELLLRNPARSRAAARDAILAGEVLAEIGYARLLRLGPRRVAYWQQAVATLVGLLAQLDTGGRPLLPVGERVRAGFALGTLGDPRFPVLREEWQQTLDEDPQGAQPELARYWCLVPAGEFLLGSAASSQGAAIWERPQRRVALPAFQIARYPVTNAQWHVFIRAGGYAEQGWWNPAGWEERRIAGWEQPDGWDDLRFNGPNQPVVGISWYEAEAFCRWLSCEIGQTVYLPSEAEWEKAARGGDGRRYPWGGRRNTSRANTVEGRIAATTPVGCYPDGASPYGVLDMAGNVWEWTATPWSEGYSQSDGTARSQAGGESLVMRGGDWGRDHLWARCSARNGSPPTVRAPFLGLRLALQVESPPIARPVGT